jgi:dihydrofolate reductase
VRSLKSETDGLINVGGADLAACLARAGLIDEYWLYMHPVVLGGGKPYFQSGLSLALKPLGTMSLSQGVTLLRYAPAG